MVTTNYRKVELAFSKEKPCISSTDQGASVKQSARCLQKDGSNKKADWIYKIGYLITITDISFFLLFNLFICSVDYTITGSHFLVFYIFNT